MAAKTQIGQCALCRQNGKELQLSHIVPHLVGRYLMKTSPGSIRRTDMPNKTVQDIEKHYLLCHDCEELFSANETWFANNIFFPYEKGEKKEFDYGEELTYFIISLSWRRLYLDLEVFAHDPLVPQETLMEYFAAEQVMREYLLRKRNNIGAIKNHIFFFDRVKHNEYTRTLNGLSSTLHRSICSYSNYAGRTAYTASMLQGILIVTFYSMDEQEQWIGTKIDINGGKIKAENQRITSIIGEDIEQLNKNLEDAYNRMSDIQKQKINEKANKLGEDIKNYPIFQDWMDDYYNE